jgi:hypothetical protein
MERPTEITSEFPVGQAWWDWGNFEDRINEMEEKYGRKIEDCKWKEIIEDERNKFENFLDKLGEEYEELGYTQEEDFTYIEFPHNSSSLKGYIDMLLEVINYLEKERLPWSIYDLNFNFERARAAGIIRFDYNKKAIKVYYVDPQYSDEFMKKIFPFGKAGKLM